MAPKAQGRLVNTLKKANHRGSQDVVTSPAIEYEAVQLEEIEALQAIYMDEFEEVHVESAWSKTSDRRFRLKLAAMSQPENAVVLSVRLTATYPKTVPLLDISGLDQFHERTQQRVQNVLLYRPKQLLGEVMIHAIAIEIEEALEDAVQARMQGTLPSLEDERANAEEEANARAKQAADEEARRHQAEQQEEQRMLDQMVEEEINRREKRKIMRTPAAVPEVNISHDRTMITFDQPAHLVDGKDDLTFSSVVVVGKCEDETLMGMPLTSTQSTSVLVAIKLCEYRNKDRADIEHLEVILNQVRMLRHSNITSLYSFRLERQKDVLAITLCTELNNRGTLRDLLSISGPVQVGRARQWTLELLEALEECHRHGIVHGSISDSNIVLHKSSGIVAKLADLGYGSPLGLSKDLPSKWRSPELDDAGSKPLTKKADIWSLGVVVLQMCLGHNVTTYSSPQNVLDKLTLSDSFEDLIERMCNRDARKRPSAFDLLASEFLRTDASIFDHDSEHSTLSMAGVRSPVARRSRDNSANVMESMSRYAQDFTEIGRLGRGGFGEVVKARNKLDGGIYAVKKINRAPQLDQILSEVMLLNRLNHPYVVRYFSTWVEETLQSSSEEALSTSEETISDSPRIEFGYQSTGGLDFVSSSGYPQIEFGLDSDEDGSETGQDNADASKNGDTSSLNDDTSRLRLKKARSASRKVQSTLYIQMEYCERRTMRDLVRKGMNEEDCWRFVRQITEGLAHVHSHGIIHRDLKPDNIFIDVAGNPKIGDFGLATTSQYQSIDRGRTFSGQTSIDMTMSVGTALYVAPEISSGAGSTYNEKVDMYSLGIIFFEMNEPFATAMERIRALQDIRRKDVMLPLSFQANGEKAAQGKVISCLISHKPSDRPSSTELLRTGLLPVKIEDETIRQALSSLSDPRSPNHQKMMSALFAHDQPAENRVKALAWDAKNHSKFDEPFKIRVKTIAKEALVTLFRLHGAEECQRETLLPRSTYYTAPNVFQLLDASGNLLQLPYDLTLPFARQLARGRLDLRRTYTFGLVYRDAFSGGPPSQAEEVDFDIVSVATSQSQALDDAELLKIMDDVSTTSALMMASDTISLHLTHAVILDAILEVCHVPGAQFMAVKECMSKLGFRQFDWPKLRSELRSSMLNLSTATVDDLEQFDFRDTPDKAYTRLKDLLLSRSPSNMERLEDALLHLKAVISMAEHLGVTRKIWIAPLSCVNAKFYEGGILFQMVHERKTSRDVLAAGGRYDNLVQSCKIGTASQQLQNAAGVSIGLDRITANMLRHAKAAHKTTFIRDIAQHEPISKRCDVLLVTGSTDATRDAGLKLLSLLWASQVSAEITTQMSNATEEQQHALVVTLRHESSTTVKVRATTDDAVETEVPMVSLVSFIQQEMRDMQGIKRKQQSAGRQSSQANVERKNNVQVLMSQHRSKKTNKYHIVEAAQQRWSEKLEQWKDAPILAVETRDDVVDLIRETRLSDPESWRKVMHGVQLNERQYIQQIQELLLTWRKQWLEGHHEREACLFNFRTGNSIYYDLGL